MGRTTGRADRRLLRAAWAGLAALLVPGCVAMPDDGAPQAVDQQQGTSAENLQVRVFPVEPRAGAEPMDVLTGFLDASIADEADYGTALKYLTADARKRWNPDAGVAVLDHRTPAATGTPGDGTAEFQLSGGQVAGLDAKHTYRDYASAKGYSVSFTLVKETDGRDKGEWRIAKLPDGLIVDQTNFKNGYRQVHRYFYTVPDSAGGDQSQTLVADPIYVRRRIDPLTAAAQALADGPSDWLSPAVRSGFSHGVRVTGPVTVGDNLVASVKVSVEDFTSKPSLCLQMADQLFFTLADQQPKRQLSQLNLAGAKGSCAVDSTQASSYAPWRLAGTGDAYYLLTNGHLMQPQGEDGGKPVPGPLGAAAQRPAALAVRRDGAAAAVVSTDRRTLSVTAMDVDAKAGEPLVTSHDGLPVGGSGDHGLSTPSWDGRQNLWVIDRDPAHRQVLVVRDKTVQQVVLPGLDGKVPVELRVSSDGTRVALLTEDSSGAASLQLGLVTRSGSGAQARISLSGLRPLAPQLTGILSFAWADSDQLLVLGKERDQVQALHYVSTDGSQSTDAPLIGADSMVSVSATEVQGTGDAAPPVLATSADSQIYRLSAGQWRELQTGKTGALFVYPG
ncbi:hypothetical protein CFP65_2713 [Kitasatospora sp. MMS16-BH015]|uniref:LpqB family beta-propeller domain-containing protein n=1 Tax=Kitasatospora sp. MMS16-BH015 TaxID=2018025 RepID=UPI000CA242E7|nr:LpqB family beta-propeller domain-containing protein [Kitasatospora sp. MMS16-BH015]AUG77534.1 hypothetical protein CFP65_2713 [Kitasatospora sp. MMS16-BH015]